MLEALYGIEFISNNNNGGYGVVVLETERIFGGDSSFVFIGSYQTQNGELTANVKCTNDRKILQSIFGDIDEFNLKLTGKPDGNYQEFILHGYVVENPNMEISIKLKRRAELP